MSASYDENDTVQFGLMESAIDTIFQLKDPKFYSWADTENKNKSVVVMIANAMADIQAVFTDDFTDGVPDMDTFKICAESEGSFACHFTYKHQSDSSTPPTNKSVVFIGKFETDKKLNGIASAQPFFIIQGIIEAPEDAGQNNVFFPVESGCRIQERGQKSDSFCFASTDVDMIQTLCYAREAFEMIVTNTPIGVRELQDWLSVDQVDRAEARFAEIVQMSPENFDVAMQWRKMTKQHEAQMMMPYPVGTAPQ